MKAPLPALALSLVLAPALAARDRPDFDRTIAPLLARHCLDCHSGPKPKGRLDLASQAGAFRGGKSGPALVPGRAQGSLLWQRVRDGEMPPKKPLTLAEQALLRSWIDSGSAWGSDPIDPFRVTTDRRAGYDWWSLRPVGRPVPPAVRDASWPKSVVDRFVLARLEAAGLAPAPEADRRTLIRRLSFDLLGLPPVPEEVEAFVHDPDPRAYEKLVDRYLAGPHHGERWARHWLDVVRFGESNGFERDLPRPTAWPYRNWVVQALNRDLPYDEFVRLQIAGDVLRPDDADAITATGFLVAGPHDTVVPVIERMRQAMHQDELEDVLGTVGQTFLGLTVHCARCHDHKFDPLSQKDYYRLAATLAGVQHGERDVRPADHDELARLQRRLDELARQLAALDEPARRAVLAARQAPGRVTLPVPLADWDFTVGPKDRRGGLHAQPRDGARFDGGLRLDGKAAYAFTAPLRADLKEKTLEAWVRLDTLAQRGGGVMSVQTRDGVIFDALVIGEREPGHWLAGSNFFQRTQPLHGPAETEADKRPVHLAVVYAADGTVSAYRDGRPYGQPYRSAGPVTFKAGDSQVVFGLRHAPAGGNKMLAGVVTKARLYDRALREDEVAASAGAAGDFVAESDLLARLTPEQRDRRAAVQAERGRLTAERQRLEERQVTKVYAAVPQQPGPTHVLARGNVTEPGELVPPAGPAALPGADWRLPADAPEGQRRLSLARWLTDAGNPLTARVMVNRVWAYHFGTGLVETPNDFGFNGGRPSHPELLDWLASEFVRQGWSLKALHRLLVTSATYRQASGQSRKPTTPVIACSGTRARSAWRRRRCATRSWRSAGRWTGRSAAGATRTSSRTSSRGRSSTTPSNRPGRSSTGGRCTGCGRAAAATRSSTPSTAPTPRRPRRGGP